MSFAWLHDTLSISFDWEWWWTTMGQPGGTPIEPGKRDPEDRVVEPTDREAIREKMFDKTVADSFPASDPPSSIPDPEEDSF
jgi:hypothetical protein